MSQLIAGVQTIDGPILVSTKIGPETRGDLETETYPLFIRFAVTPTQPPAEFVATLGTAEQPLYTLHSAMLADQGNQVIIDLTWSLAQAEPIYSARNDIVFVHILDLDSGQVVAQSDTVPGHGFWPVYEWRSNMLLHAQYKLKLNQPWDSGRFQAVVGVYPADNPQNRLQIETANGQTGGNTVEIR